MANQRITQLDKHENEAIARLHSRINLRHLSNNAFRQLLLQRRLFALHFTPAYEHVLVGLNNDDAKKVVRELIREEYPARAPSHREDIVHDLQLTGLTKKEILTTPATPTTQQAIHDLYALITYTQPDYDIKGLLALRTTYEVSVAEEYEKVMDELTARFGITPEQSRFYFPHYEHDRKQTPLTTTGGTNGWISHTDGFNDVLARLITTDEQLALAKKTIDDAMQIKIGFYR